MNHKIKELKKIKRRPFGSTGAEVTEISLGAMNLRTLPDHAAVEKFLNQVLDTGINLLDTARSYNTRDTWETSNKTGVYISSEEMIGKVLSERPAMDEPLIIVTKGHGYAQGAFDEDFETSCRCLRIRKTKDGLFIGETKIYLVYFLHGINAERWAGIEASGVLDHAKARQAAGDFTWFGFSSHYGDGAAIKQAIDTGAFQVCELPYNIYNPSLGEEGEVDLIKYAHDRGMAVINMKAYNGNGTASIFPQLARVSGFGYREMTRFCLSNPYLSTIDAGATTIGQIQADIEASLEPALAAKERAALRERAKRLSPHLDHICRECMHCVEKFACPMGIDFPGILALYGRYKLSVAVDLASIDFKGEYGKFTPDASRCAACGKCVPWCEYHLDIPRIMRQAAADLG